MRPVFVIHSGIPEVDVVGVAWVVCKVAAVVSQALVGEAVVGGAVVVAVVVGAAVVVEGGATGDNT